MQDTLPIELAFQLEDVNPADFYGVNNEHLEQVKRAFPDVRIVARGSELKALGDTAKLMALQGLIDSLLREIRFHGALSSHRVGELVRSNEHGADSVVPAESPHDKDLIVRGPTGNPIRARTDNQKKIVRFIEEHDVVFAVGPAGSGKTYTAVALAVRALKNREVKKIVLVRPAVEAGESLGFLPGDLREKIDPYLRPLYDALEDMIHPPKLREYMDKNIIEIAPLAYMRGRTLSHSFIILDEAQNATELQMKMLLTRMGMDSKIVVTGDVTQIDLPRTQRSGLIQCTRILEDVKGVGFVWLDRNDVVRHPTVRHILAAYEKAENA